MQLVGPKLRQNRRIAALSLCIDFALPEYEELDFHQVKVDTEP